MTDMRIATIITAPIIGASPHAEAIQLIVTKKGLIRR